MSVIELIQAVNNGDLAMVEELLQRGVDVNGHGDEQEWTPLNYASGRGDINMVKLLLDKGADVFNVGCDQRTPYEIALAAGHIKVAQLLRDIEDKVDPEGAKISSRKVPKYCKAYYLRDLRQFPNWTESKINWNKESTEREKTIGGSSLLSDNHIVFLHTDFSVTNSIWHKENVIFNQVTDDWKRFCIEVLKFSLPDDLKLAFHSNIVSEN